METGLLSVACSISEHSVCDSPVAPANSDPADRATPMHTRGPDADIPFGTLQQM